MSSRREDIQILATFARSALEQEKERAQQVVNTLNDRIRVVEKSLERIESQFPPVDSPQGDNIEDLDIVPENE